MNQRKQSQTSLIYPILLVFVVVFPTYDNNILNYMHLTLSSHLGQNVGLGEG